MFDKSVTPNAVGVTAAPVPPGCGTGEFPVASGKVQGRGTPHCLASIRAGAGRADARRTDRFNCPRSISATGGLALGISQWRSRRSLARAVIRVSVLALQGVPPVIRHQAEPTDVRQPADTSLGAAPTLAMVSSSNATAC